MFYCLEQTFWIIYKSPSTCETLFFCRIQSKICLWRWQTCRLNIIVEVEWTFQFENDPVVVWYTVSVWILVIFKSRIGIFDDLVNIFDLGLKSVLDHILVKFFLLIKPNLTINTSQYLIIFWRKIRLKIPVLHSSTEEIQLWCIHQRKFRNVLQTI